jgi:hypothetical protein
VSDTPATARSARTQAPMGIRREGDARTQALEDAAIGGDEKYDHGLSVASDLKRRGKYNLVKRPDCNLRIPLWELVRASTAAPVCFSPEVIPKISMGPVIGKGDAGAPASAPAGA